MSEPKEPKKVFAVITVARQIDGEYVFVKTEKAFFKAEKAEAEAKRLRATFVTKDDKVKPIKVSTAQGEAVCSCTVGVFDLEVSDE
jgi:hypothetical protein